jgi:hypothetical protein
MSKAKIIGFARNTLYPGPSLTITQATDGATTATMDFRCIKGDIGGLQIRKLLAKGVGIENLYSSIPAYYRFLTVESWDASDEAGAITTVSVKFTGTATPEPETPEDDPSSESTTYTRNTSLKESPIQASKEFTDLTSAATFKPGGKESNEDGQPEPNLIAGGIRGDFDQDGATYAIRDKITHEGVGTITSAAGIAMWNKCVRDGITTCRTPTTEWTESGSKLGRLTNAQVAFYGRIWGIEGRVVPGNPTVVEVWEKSGTWWFTGITENIEGSDTGVSTNRYTRTWTCE